jgi:hypothetical protein
MFPKSRRLPPNLTLIAPHPLGPLRSASSAEPKVETGSNGELHLRQRTGMGTRVRASESYRNPDVVTAETLETYQELGNYTASRDILRFQQTFGLGSFRASSEGHTDIGQTVRTYEFEHGKVVEHALFNDERGHVREVHVNRPDADPVILSGRWLGSVDGLGLGRLISLEEKAHPLRRAWHSKLPLLESSDAVERELVARFEWGTATAVKRNRDPSLELAKVTFSPGSSKEATIDDSSLLKTVAGYARERKLGAFRAVVSHSGDGATFDFTHGRLVLKADAKGRWHATENITDWR